MVKFANRGKGAPSKRRTLKVKFKIERRVKQYKKKVKKQAKKMKDTGIKHKRNPDKDNLPNLFPFKNQMLQEFKQTLPKEPQAPIEVISSAEYGLVTLENKPVYLPKGRDNLTKKFITNIENILKHTKIVLQVLDSRCPQICIDQNFRAICKKNHVQRITILTKIDTVSKAKVSEIQEKLKAKKDKVLKFTQDTKFRKQLIEEVIKTIKQIKAQMGLQEKQNISIFVAGKATTGKHTLISSLCKYAGKYQDLPSQLFQLILIPGVKLMDAPFRIQDLSKFPLFHIPSDLRQQESVCLQEQTLIKHLFFGGLSNYPNGVLNRNSILQHFMIQDYISIEDFCKKVGKSLRLFGKGGMIDVTKARQKVLTEWFVGKLNKSINAYKQE